MKSSSAHAACRAIAEHVPLVEPLAVVALTGSNAPLLVHEAGHRHRDGELDLLLPIEPMDFIEQDLADRLPSLVRVEPGRVEANLELPIEPGAERANAPARLQVGLCPWSDRRP